MLYFYYRHLFYNSFFIKILRYFLPLFFRWFFRISIKELSSSNLKPPYLIFAQHSCLWYLLVYNLQEKKPFHFVATGNQFCASFMRFILALMGIITVKKSAFSMNTAVEIIRILKTRKESICIFPEKIHTWDDSFSQIAVSTAQFVKQAEVPVVCVRSDRAYLSYLRWVKAVRRGMWHVEYTPCLTPKSIAKLDNSAILTYLKKALYNNEYENHRRSTKHLIFSKKAEYIEHVLFACPYCHTMQNLVSRKTFFYCRVCCNMWKFRSDGFIQRRRHGPLLAQKVNNGEEYVTTVAQWDAWQQEFLQHLMRTKKTSHLSHIFYDEDMRLFWGKKRMVGEHCGSCELTCSELIFIPHNALYSHENSFRVAIADMKNVNVQHNEKLEWISPQGMTYQLKSRNPRVNIYKYLCALIFMHAYEAK